MDVYRIFLINIYIYILKTIQFLNININIKNKKISKILLYVYNKAFQPSMPNLQTTLHGQPTNSFVNNSPCAACKQFCNQLFIRNLQSKPEMKYCIFSPDSSKQVMLNTPVLQTLVLNLSIFIRSIFARNA